MKVSLNWVKQFTDVDLSVDQLVEKIGVQLGAVEEVIDLGKKYQGIIVAKVVICDKHPNADKLSVCWIDDGGKATDVERNEQGLVQVVCGAPNVRAGLLVAWLPPGCTVPNSYDTDPFVLGSRELRGVVSNGMLASASELAISDDHNGIVEIEIDATPGSDFAEVYQLNDSIIDIENKMFTHRPDCFGVLGVAREVAGISHKSFTSPDWYLQGLDRIRPGKTKLELTTNNTLPDLVPRFMAIAMADVTVKPSPLMLQTYLSRVGLRPINNLVDITNYLMVLTGQPTHAFDADKLLKLGGLSLETRMSRPGDKLHLLNGKTLELQDDTSILITSNDIPVGLAGVMGGADTEVDDTTKNIIIECANFDMYSVRRSSMKYGIFTDAVTRFNKGQSRLQNDRVLEEAVALVQGLAGGHVASTVHDTPAVSGHQEAVQTTADFVNQRLGVSLPAQEMATLLTNVEFEVAVHDDQLVITPPFWRTDIEIPEDIVEEIGRLYGLDRLPLELPVRPITPVLPNTLLALKSSLRTTLAGLGANEVLTYGFVHGDLLTKAKQDVALAFKLSNALSPDLQYYRLSLTPSLLDKVHSNIKAGFSQFALFEIGKVHSKSELADDGLPKEFDRVALTLAIDDKQSQTHKSGSAYYLAQKYTQVLFGDSEIELRYVPVAEAGYKDHALFQQLLAPFEPERSAVVMAGDKLAGVVGEYKQSVKRALKLPKYSAGFELFLSSIPDQQTGHYTTLSRFPKVSQDITLKVPAGMSYKQVTEFVHQSLHLPDQTHHVLMPLGAYRKEDDDQMQFSFRLILASYQRTLTAGEVNALLDQVAEAGTERGISRV